MTCCPKPGDLVRYDGVSFENTIVGPWECFGWMPWWEGTLDNIPNNERKDGHFLDGENALMVFTGHIICQPSHDGYELAKNGYGRKGCKIMAGAIGHDRCYYSIIAGWLPRSDCEIPLKTDLDKVLGTMFEVIIS